MYKGYKRFDYANFNVLKLQNFFMAVMKFRFPAVKEAFVYTQ